MSHDLLDHAPAYTKSTKNSLTLSVSLSPGIGLCMARGSKGPRNYGFGIYSRHTHHSPQRIIQLHVDVHRRKHMLRDSIHHDRDLSIDGAYSNLLYTFMVIVSYITARICFRI